MFAKTFNRSLKTYAVLKPFVDVDARLCKINQLKSNIRRRKLDVNLDDIAAFNETFKKLDSVKARLEESREDIKRRLCAMESLSDDSEEKIKLKMTAKIVREDYKQCRSSVSDLEQNLIGLMMGVPNDLHAKTGNVDEAIHECSVVCGGTECHLDVGKRLDLLEYRSPWECFLKGDAAAFELNSVADLSKTLKSEGFLGFSNPDFSREIVVDGCEGVNSCCLRLIEFEGDQDTTFINGGASPLPFFSYFTKSVIPENDLPLKCFSTGRRYSYEQAPKFALFDAPQTNACQVFILTSPACEDELLHKLTSILTKFYETYNVRFRVVVKGASELRLTECLRISFELFSPHFDKFFECGHISMYGTLPSKTMNIHCGGSDTNNEFVSVISGTVLQVAPLLACVLETKGSL